MKSQAQSSSDMFRAKHLSPLELRSWAERRLAHGRRPRIQEDVDASRLLYELHVHDAELEIQNEELRRVHCELEKALSRSQELIDLAPVGYLQIDERGVIDAANWTACAMFSTPLSDLVGRELSSLALAEDASLVHGHIQYVAHSGARHSCDVRVLVPPDERRILRLASTPGTRASDRSVCTALIDITEFKRVEEARRDHDLRRRAVEEVSLDGIFILDGSGTIIHSNGAASRVFGYSASELPGLDFRKLVPAWPSLVSEGESGPTRGVPHAAGFGRRKDGGSFPMEVSWCALGDGSRRSTVVVKERSDDIFLESVFRRAEKMDAVGTLAAGISHDVKNVLSGILCFAESALRRSTDEDFRGDLQQIKESVATAVSIVHQLVRTVSANGHAPQRLLVEPTVRRLEPLLARLLGDRIKLTVNLCPRGAAIEAFSGDLEQILLNLVLNARDAVHDTGTVRVETEECVLGRGEEGPRSFVVLRVTDTGSGMDARTKAQLFHPFFTTKAERGGTGVGLMTVAATVKRLGGWIDVASRLGQGTVFSLYFPRLEASSSLEGDPPPSSTSSRTPPEHRLSGVVAKAQQPLRTILVVDDDTSTRVVLQRLLADIPYRVFTAATAPEALRIAERETIDVLLLDLFLRDGRDDTLVDRLREQNSELAVLVVTGWPFAETEAAQKGPFAHPRTRFLSKPVEFDGIASAISELLGESSEASVERR